MKAFAAILAFVLAASCKTAYPLHGMVYDQDSRPVTGYELAIDGKRKAVTDINGRFTFAKTKYGGHTVEGTGGSYLPFSEAYRFTKGTDILHLKLVSIHSLYRDLDRAISARDFTGAKKLLDSFPESERTSPRFILYDGIYRFRTTGDLR